MSSFYLDIRALRAFVLTVETGSLTEASRRIGRTQSAVTQQIQKLEQLFDQKAFEEDRRGLMLTEFGTILLSHARQILQKHDDCVRQLLPDRTKERVVLGVPDLYAASLLPPILREFGTLHPEIRVELVCAMSRPLVARIQDGSVDVALVTRMDGFTGGDVIGSEQLVWVTGEQSSAHLSAILPLALLPPGNIYRDHAIETLDQAGRSWEIACISDSAAGLQTAALSGIAVTAMIDKSITTGLRRVPESAGLPDLPSVDLLLYRASTGGHSAAVDTLHSFLAMRVERLSADRSNSPNDDPKPDYTSELEKLECPRH